MLLSPFPAVVHRTKRGPGKLLNESLAEHRKALKKQATNLLAAKKFKKVERG